VAGTESGRLLNPVYVGDVVQSVRSPFLQLATARTLAKSPDGRLELDRPAQPLRLRWRATGLLNDGTVPPSKAVALRAWPGARAARLTLLVLATGPAPATFAFEFGGRTHTTSIKPNMPVRVSAGACTDAGGGASGTVRTLAGSATLLQASVATATTCR
jgi:hypothetical protein